MRRLLIAAALALLFMSGCQRVGESCKSKTETIIVSHENGSWDVVQRTTTCP